MSWLDALLGTVFSRGVEVSEFAPLDFAAPLRATLSANETRIEVSADRVWPFRATGETAQLTEEDFLVADAGALSPAVVTLGGAFNPPVGKLFRFEQEGVAALTLVPTGVTVHGPLVTQINSALMLRRVGVGLFLTYYAT